MDKTARLALAVLVVLPLVVLYFIADTPPVKFQPGDRVRAVKTVTIKEHPDGQLRRGWFHEGHVGTVGDGDDYVVKSQTGDLFYLVIPGGDTQTGYISASALEKVK